MTDLKMSNLLRLDTSFGLRRSSTNQSPTAETLPSNLSGRSSSPGRSAQTTSGSANAMQSLLSPINPAFDDLAPNGGILLNKRRPSDTPDFSEIMRGRTDSVVSEGSSGNASSLLPTSPTLSSSAGAGNGELRLKHTRTISNELSPIISSSSNDNQTSPSPRAATAARPAPMIRAPSSAKIRFAPLPTPNRKRSLSTGHDLAVEAEFSADGSRTQRISRRIGNENWTDTDGEIDDPDEIVDDDSEDSGEKKDKRTSGSWMTMGIPMNVGKRRNSSFGTSSGSYTKKLLKPFSLTDDSGSGRRASDIGDLTFGVPLKKSVSTGTSYKSNAEQDRKKNFLGVSTSRGRVGSDTPDFSSLSSSLGYKADTDFAPTAKEARPVKMLNGRVYGAKKGQSPAGKKQEPGFVEWGGIGGSAAGGLGSNQSSRRDEDEDDGGGMSWVKKRKEERERQRRESELAAATFSKESVEEQEQALSVGSVPDVKVTPPLWAQESPESPGAHTGRNDYISVAPEHDTIQEEGHDAGGHAVQAIAVPGARRNRERRRDDTALSSGSEGEDDDDDDDDGDFEPDEEDELEEEERAKERSTSSAAGVEVMIRHKE